MVIFYFVLVGWDYTSGICFEHYFIGTARVRNALKMVLAEGGHFWITEGVGGVVVY